MWNVDATQLKKLGMNERGAAQKKKSDANLKVAEIYHIRKSRSRNGSHKLRAHPVPALNSSDLVAYIL